MPLWPLLNPRQTSLINHSLPFSWAWMGPQNPQGFRQLPGNLPGIGKGVETYFLSFILFIESPSFLTRVDKQAAYKMTKIFRHAVFLPTQYCFKISFECLSLRQVVYHSPDFSSCLTSGPCCTPVLLLRPNRVLIVLSSAHCWSVQRALRTFIHKEEYVTEWQVL